MSDTGRLFQVTFGGFQPGEAVGITSECKRERLANTTKATESGEIVFPVAFGPNSDDPVVWYGHAHLLSDFRQPGDQERMEAFKRAIALKPDYYPALHDFAIAQMKAGRYAEGYETLNQLEKYHGDDRDIAWTRGDLDLATKRYEDAVKHYGAAIAKDPREPRLHFEIARAYRKLGRMEESQREMNRVKELRPDQAQFYDTMFSHTQRTD